VKIENFLKLFTFFFIIFIGSISSWASQWHLGPYMLSLLIILSAYVLLLVLPITKFKLSTSGFEGELDRLSKEPKSISVATVQEVNQQIETFSGSTVEPDLLLMRLSIEIETTLRSIAEKSGMTNARVGMGMLVKFLRQKEIVTDSWLIDALSFFQKYRNELVHEGKTSDIEKGIDLGKNILVKLKEINTHLN
jgi:hypothetical protein